MQSYRYTANSRDNFMYFWPRESTSSVCKMMSNYMMSFIFDEHKLLNSCMCSDCCLMIWMINSLDNVKNRVLLVRLAILCLVFLTTLFFEFFCFRSSLMVLLRFHQGFVTKKHSNVTNTVNLHDDVADCANWSCSVCAPFIEQSGI